MFLKEDGFELCDLLHIGLAIIMRIVLNLRILSRITFGVRSKRYRKKSLLEIFHKKF